MGKQINFYMDELTELRFVDFILSSGGQVLFLQEIDKPKIIQTLPVPFSVNGWFKLFLYKSEYGELDLRKLDDGRVYINAYTSPVIEFSRTIKRENEIKKLISSGRLWVELKYWNEKGEQVEKIKELDKWYGTLNRWIKKNLVKVEEITEGVKYIKYVSTTLIELKNKGYEFI